MLPFSGDVMYVMAGKLVSSRGRSETLCVLCLMSAIGDVFMFPDVAPLRLWVGGGCHPGV